MKKENYYENSERKISWLRIVLLLLVIALILLLAWFLLGNKNNANKAENNLLNAGKEFYKSEDVSLPNAAGECSVVTLEQLLINDYIRNEKLFNGCDNITTSVKVCKLESGEYHYTPVIKCDNDSDTIFGDWKQGSENDLVKDKSDVKFTFMPMVYSTQIKNYYPNNKDNADGINELYVTSPNNEYTYKDNGVSASKWYTEKTGTTYWNNGDYSSTQPNGFANRGNEGAALVSITSTLPATADYRKIEEIALYRTTNIDKPSVLAYYCEDFVYVGFILSNTPCESRAENNYNVTTNILYTCDGKTEVDKNTICSTGEPSDWTTTACITSDTIKCETSKGYKITDQRWQWYSTGKYRSYYPSGATNAKSEKTYYVNAPIAGAIKDGSTTTTAYNFYKLIESNTGSDGKWINISDKYLIEDELIKLFNDKGYEINSLEEIEDNEKIKYSLRLEYSNRE